ncbi:MULTISPECIES: type III-B CRISPR module RAMP protein Cmr6 [Geobacillus]|uniref:Cmr6 family CRISPR-associated RAMP protein n=2 Tax=Geobacillus thermoleovorans group TaxID=1505648 RepID=U2Y7D4_GEOKU|nr:MULTISPECIES: type III-B CRISPR module RAMP protein Cmr6 [Geobacillus]MED4923851.1 type III-B CRISPR module RAMP protein Cmr6 [Anoxybacillus geothermalis]AUI36558.1 type III-B CRISPR module RAMP protein Cmr6 [[Bacillus] caldolyticus]MBW7644153.1 type III-B CRISPR module RAMP protein Cmr6 [Geobacillus thermoleovorans]MED3722584.1 type III-B CRISPR module RAMP protein Cmr6 [Geobacillus stearothermophilus]MED3768941.1 type III-B CRISPR module RAMP protein Cmr6 [Geobacillus stearothermophilus]
MLFHPKDTLEVVQKANKSIGHLAYHLHYFIEHRWNDRKKVWEPSKQLKSAPILPELKEVGEQLRAQREQAMVEWAQTGGVKKLKARLSGRIVHGLGAGHVRETSLTIHPVYGLPYIPASSLKGLVRHWFIEAYCEGDEKRLGEHEDGRAIFGTQGNKGQVQFYDIFLIDGLRLEKDVLAVHMKEYYEGKNAATDNQKPVPVSFWTVMAAEADIYLTAYGFRDDEKTARLLEAASLYTKQALMEWGIGSKTSSGYGRFSEVDDVTETEFLPMVQKERARLERRKIEQEMVERKRREEEERARLALLSPEERLVAEIERLADSEADKQRSKDVLYQQVLEQRNKQAALALQAYWQRIGEWGKGISKKQKQKIDKLQQLLNDE